MRQRLFIKLTEKSACPFSPGKEISRADIITVNGNPQERPKVREQLRETLAGNGFYPSRTNENDLSCRSCMGCSECVPLRINLENFEPSKTDRRLLRDNAGVRLQYSTSFATPQLYKLRLEYLKHRHPQNLLPTYEDFRDFMGTDGRVRLATLRDEGGDPFCAVLYDQGDDRFHDLECFYDPAQMGRSPGRLSMLRLIEQARNFGRQYYYIGDWSDSAPRLSYKAAIHALEARTQEGWVPFDPTRHTKGITLTQMLRSQGYNVLVI
jgi:leucyl-tRNA---protein transferase